MRFAAFAALLLAACSSAPTAGDAKPTGGVPIASRGLSCESAVVIEARNTDAGINREMAWIRENYPGSKIEGQSLTKCNDKPADAIHLVTADGNKVTIYFDISGWFGKW